MGSGYRSPNTFAIFFFFYYSFLGIVTPYLSLYFSDIGLQALQIAMLMSMLQITRIIGPFAWGWLSDYRQDRIGIMRTTSTISMVVFCGIFFSNSFWSLLVWMFLLNSFSSGLTPLGEAATLHALRKDDAFEARYGRLRLWGSIGFIVAVTLGGFWFEAKGIQTLPWFGLATLAMVCLLSWFLWEPPLDGHPLVKGQLRSIVRQSGVLWFFSSSFWMIFAHATLYVFYSLYLKSLGYDKVMIGLFWVLGVSAEVIFFYFQKNVFQRFKPRKILEFAFLIGIVRFVVIAYYPLFGLLLLGQVLHAFTFAAHHSASIRLMQDWFKGATQARGQALYTSISYGLGGTVGGLCAGWVWDHIGPSHAFGISALACFLAYLSILQVRQKNHIAE